jgi:bacterioferritin (cytochrome b1)
MEEIQGDCRKNSVSIGNLKKFAIHVLQVDFKKTYADAEDKTRFKLFTDTLEQIKEHNEKFKKGLADMEAGLNEYSDWNDEEKRKLVQ